MNIYVCAFSDCIIPYKNTLVHHLNMPLDKTAFELKALFYIKGDINSILLPDFIDGQTVDVQF